MTNIIKDHYFPLFDYSFLLDSPVSTLISLSAIFIVGFLLLHVGLYLAKERLFLWKRKPDIINVLSLCGLLAFGHFLYAAKMRMHAVNSETPYHQALGEILESNVYKINIDQEHVFIEEILDSSLSKSTSPLQGKPTNNGKPERAPRILRLYWKDAEALSQKLSIPRLNPYFYLKDSRS